LNNINTRNYSQKTNYMCGSSAMKILPFYVTSLVLPSITTNIPELSGRQGAIVNLAPGGMTFGSLSLQVLLDENYQVYKDIFRQIKIDVKTGTFVCDYFDFWSSFTNDMGEVVMKVEYHNCIIESLDELSFETNTDETEQTFGVSIKFDYFEIIDEQNIPELRK